MDKPLVSIIINNYNYARFLTEAIESALNQTYKNIEVIVVDDGSTDNSREIIMQYGDRLVPILKENGGQASAFNAGFQISKGDIILFLDADDTLKPSAIDKVVQAWSPSLSKVQFKLQIIDGQSRTEDNYIPSNMMTSGDLLPTLLQTGIYSFPPTSGNAWNRSYLSSVLPMPEAEWRIAADGYMLFLAPLFGQIYSINEPLGLYRIHGSNNWSVTQLNVDRLRANLQHDKRKEQLLNTWLEKLGKPTMLPNDKAPIHLRTRIASLSLDPQQHPFPQDTLVGLGLLGTSLSWTIPQYSLQKRLAYSFYFLALAFLPKQLSQIVALWATSPNTRPKFLQKIR